MQDETETEQEIRRKRLVYRSWHRGTKELDLLLGEFARVYLQDFDERELDQFEAILDSDEHDIYGWLSGRAAVPAEHENEVMRRLLAFNFAEHRS